MFLKRNLSKNQKVGCNLWFIPIHGQSSPAKGPYSKAWIPMIFRHTGGRLLAYRGTPSGIPGDAFRHTGGRLPAYRGTPSGIPGDAFRHTGGRLPAYRGTPSGIPGDAFRHTGGRLPAYRGTPSGIPGDAFRHTGGRLLAYRGTPSGIPGDADTCFPHVLTLRTLLLITPDFHTRCVRCVRFSNKQTRTEPFT